MHVDVLRVAALMAATCQIGAIAAQAIYLNSDEYDEEYDTGLCETAYALTHAASLFVLLAAIFAIVPQSLLNY